VSFAPLPRSPPQGLAPKLARNDKRRFGEVMVARTTIRACALGLLASGCATTGAPPTPASPEAVAAGELIVEPPTLISLGFEWMIEGDADRDAHAEIYYRRPGEPEWRRGLDLMRLQNERTIYSQTLDYTAPNMFAGSLFELEPGTAYEVRLVLSDPDGVAGEAERIVTAATRAEPEPYAGGRVLHVYPPDHEGPREEPAFGGLLAAFYTEGLGGDWSRASPPRVGPGDTILVHAGVYRSDYLHYSREILTGYRSCCGTPWDGTYYLSADGEPGKPIAIVAAGDGEAIFDGGDNTVLFNVMGGDHLLFRGLTFRNTGTVFEAGQKDVAGAEGLTVQRSRFEDVGVVVHSDWSGSKSFTVTDNVMIGRNDPDIMFGWYGLPWTELPDYDERSLLRSFYAVSIYGSGHVVAHNAVSGFHDGIDHATYGMPDDWPDTPRDRMPVSIDFYGNDISNVHDNCLEADGAMHNVRVFRNRCMNAAVGAMSPQPVFGGPVYFMRNVVYNSPFGPLKVQADPSGVMVLNNTFIGEISQLTPASNVHLRNNLVIGQNRRDQVLAIDTRTAYSSSDYNGFRVNPGDAAAFRWSAPPEGQATLYGAALEPRYFETLADYVAATGQDAHSALVDYDVFERAAPPDPSDPTRLYRPDDVDLRLRAGSAAIDAGVAIPGVTDDFSGAAPDLGAYERDREPPRYGPRPEL
jgi:hypothetical protein